MKKAKIVLWLVLIGFAVMLFFENKDFLMDKQSFQVNLFIGGPHYTPALPNILYFLAFFACGLLIAYFWGLSSRFQANKTIKNLQSELQRACEKPASGQPASEETSGGRKNEDDSKTASAG